MTSGTLTDGTAILTAGTITGATTISGTTLTDGNATLTGGVISGVSDINATGTMTSGTLTDGNATLTGGAITGLDSVNVNKLTVNTDASFNGSVYFNGDLSWNSTNIAPDSIPPSAIIGGVGSNEFSGEVVMQDDLSLNGRLFIGQDASLNKALFVKHHVGINSSIETSTYHAITQAGQKISFVVPLDLESLVYFNNFALSSVKNFTIADGDAEDKIYNITEFGDTYFTITDENGATQNSITLYRGNKYTFVANVSSVFGFSVGTGHKVNTNNMIVRSDGSGTSFPITTSSSIPYPLDVNGVIRTKKHLYVEQDISLNNNL